MAESVLSIGIQPLIMAITAIATLGVAVGLNRGRLEALRRDNEELRSQSKGLLTRVTRLESQAQDIHPW